MHKPVRVKFLANFFICLLSVLTVRSVVAQNPAAIVDTLLRKADNLYLNDPQRGIAAAKHAFDISIKTKSILPQLRCMDAIVRFYWGIADFKTARLFAQRGSIMARESKVDSLTGDFLVLTGAIDQVKNNYDLAIANYKNAIPYYNTNKLQRRVGNTYLNIGICEMKLSRFEEANTCFFKSAELFKNLKDTTDLTAAYNSMGVCFTTLNYFKKATAYHHNALYLRGKLRNNDALIAQSLNNLGFAFKENRKPDSAIFYLAKCLAMRKNIKDTSILVLTLQNLGWSWKMKGNLAKAEKLILRSIQIASNYHLQEDLANGYLALADIYISQKKYNPALKVINISESTAEQLHVPDLLLQVYATKFNLYMQKAEYKTALFFSIKKDKLKDSIYTIAKNKSISELEIRYQTRQKEKDIAALNNQNKLQVEIVKQQKLSIITLTAAALGLMVLFGFAYRNYNAKNKANQRIQTLMHDLHHRVKNNLQLLSGLFTMQIATLSDEKTKKTLRENETRLMAMNLIHSKLYLDHNTTQIEMSSYLSDLLQNIKASFSREDGQDINLRLEIEPINVEADKAVAIGLLVNEIATNAFKHAFDDRWGEIYLSLKQQGRSTLLLTLGDNGKGISHLHKERDASFGLKLVDLMVRQLNAKMQVLKNDGLAYHFEINV